MQKYKQYCPVARASEILADRWTPLIVRELILGSHRFNEIERGLPGISRSLLASRLRDLEDSGVVERLPGAQPKMTEYHLSEAGRELKTVIETLGAWGVRWAFGEPRPEELDAGLLIWRIHQRINRELLPETAYGRRVRLHRSSRTTGVAAARAPGGVGLRDAARIRFRSHRPRGSGVLLSCLVGTHRLRRRHSLSVAWSSKGFPLLRSSFRAGSCGVRWRVSFGNASMRWRSARRSPSDDEHVLHGAHDARGYRGHCRVQRGRADVTSG